MAIALHPRRKSRSLSNLDHDKPFSWLRCLVSLVSYALLLSDVVRTGLGVREISRSLQRLEPDSIIFIGPVGYAANHLTLTNATAQVSGSRWLYKYDTTSIGMRAFAEHLRLPSWSPCVLYQARCDETHGLPLSSIFTMVDTLVAAIEPRAITLRVENRFRDRLHHYVMPWFYEHAVKRTIQATHYKWKANEVAEAAVCNSPKGHRPYSCAETWTHYLKAACKLTPHECRNARRVWREIPRRIQSLMKLYPGGTIDSVVLDGADDYTRGGLTYQGRRRAEVVVFSRVRSCVDHVCTTLAVDDYRFESMAMVMNASEWFGIVGLLRLFGQVYTWLRVLLLVRICHVARANASWRYRRASPLTQCLVVLRTLFLVPSQVVIYGSLLPISLYYLAHLIDSPVTYALAAIHFNSLFGTFTVTFVEFIHHCAVSMRAVWVLSFYCHLLVSASATVLWSPAHGVPGVSELFISSIASLTIFAEYRALVLRNTKVLSMYEIVSSARIRHLRAYSHNAAPTALNNLLFGSTVDWKCLQSAVAMLALVCAALWAMNWACPKLVPYQVSMVSYTLVPFSAGHLWPRNRLVVSWFGSLVKKKTLESKTEQTLERSAHISQLHAIAMPVFPNGKTPRSSALRTASDRGLVLRSTRASKQAQRELQSTTSRSREIDSAIYLMNLAVMTDPLTILRLRFFAGYQVGLYASKVTHQQFLLPCDVRASDADIAIDWDELELVATANTKDLAWDDLLRCG